MDFSAIEVVSRTLRQFLEAAFAAQNIGGGVYVGPLDDDDARDAAAVLFLYRVSVNADLRNTEHRVPSSNPAAPTIVHRDSLPLNLQYLLTAGTAQTGGELQSLRVLGCAIQALNQEPNLVGVDVGGETVRVTLDPVSSEEMSRIWTLFPTANYRTSIVYLASPVWIDPLLGRAEGPPVTREPHRIGHAVTS